MDVQLKKQRLFSKELEDKKLLIWLLKSSMIEFLLIQESNISLWTLIWRNKDNLRKISLLLLLVVPMFIREKIWKRLINIWRLLIKILMPLLIIWLSLWKSLVLILRLLLRLEKFLKLLEIQLLEDKVFLRELEDKNLLILLLKDSTRRF